MKKKILIGFSAVCLSAAFWACGDGSIESMGASDDAALGLYGYANEDGSSPMAGMVNDAMARCKEDPECVAAQTGADPLDVPPAEESSSEAAPASSATSAAGSATSSAAAPLSSATTALSSSAVMSSSSSAAGTGSSSSVVSSSSVAAAGNSSSSVSTPSSTTSSAAANPDPGSSAENSTSAVPDGVVEAGGTISGGGSVKVLATYNAWGDAVTVESGTYSVTCIDGEGNGGPKAVNIICKADADGATINGVAVGKNSFEKAAECQANLEFVVVGTVKCAAVNY